MNPISKYPNNQILITQSPNNLHKHRLIKKFIYIIVFVILGLWQLSYSQDDYLEIKGDTRVDTLTFSGDRTGDASAPVRGELFYNSTLGRPHYFDGTDWQEFRGQDRYVATLIVAASNSLDTSRADYVCDGTDDQETINRAINDLPASGGAVYLLEGTYNISDVPLPSPPETRKGILPHTNTAIIGSGRGTVLRFAGTGDNVNIIYVRSVNHVLVSQLMIDGNGQTGTNIDGIEFQSVTNSQIDKVWVENVKDQGIHIESSNNNIISNNNVWMNGGEGIAVGTSSNNILLGNNVQENNYDGIDFGASSNNILLGNNVQENDDDGLDFDNSSNNIVYGNNIQSNDNDGIDFDGPSDNNTFTGNIFQSNLNHGIDIDGSSNNTFTGNIVWSNGWDGINFTANGSNNLLYGNISYDNGGTGNYDGIEIQNNSDNNLVSSNLLYDSSGTGDPIEIAGGPNGDSNNNYLVGNLVSAWPGNRTINDSGTNTQYTDKVKMTLERRVDHSGFPPLDVTTNPRSYVYLIPPSNINLTLIDGKAAGDLLIIENGHAINTITVDDIGGNINLEAQRILHLYDILKLIWNGNRWLEMEFANNTPP